MPRQAAEQSIQFMSLGSVGQPCAPTVNQHAAAARPPPPRVRLLRGYDGDLVADQHGSDSEHDLRTDVDQGESPRVFAEKAPDCSARPASAPIMKQPKMLTMSVPNGKRDDVEALVRTPLTRKRATEPIKPPEPTRRSARIGPTGYK